MEPATLCRLDCPPLAGSVYGVLLNFRGDVESLGEKVRSAPYQAPPLAPVLYVKPRNTLNFVGAPLALPPETEALQVCASMGLVFGRTATRVARAQAMDCIAGIVLLTEVSVPHEEIFRPALRQRCRDGFTPIAPRVVEFAASRLSQLRLRTYVNGELRCELSVDDLVRPVDALVSDISQFMSLRAGDVLSLGMPRRAPLARLGDSVVAEAPGIARIENAIAREPPWSTEP